MTETTVREERNHWRNQAISERHRLWGFNVPMVDIDFLVIEYSAGKTKAIIEYKHECEAVDFTVPNDRGMHPKSYSALNNLANRAWLPFFVVVYSDDFKSWKVYPRNMWAKEYLKQEVTMSEEEYIIFLYKLRGMFAPPEILTKINELHLTEVAA